MQTCSFLEPPPLSVMLFYLQLKICGGWVGGFLGEWKQNPVFWTAKRNLGKIKIYKVPANKEVFSVQKIPLAQFP